MSGCPPCFGKSLLTQRDVRKVVPLTLGISLQEHVDAGRFHQVP